MNWRLVAWWVTAAGLAGWAVAHFALVLLVLAPWNALPHDLRGTANAYVDPILRQGWWFFAPNPPLSDRRLYVRGTYIEGGDRRTTPWLALSEPVTEAVQRDRLSSHDAVLTVLVHGMHSLTDGALLQLPPVSRDLVIAGWRNVPRQPASLVALERVGSAALAAEYPELELEEVQLRLTLRRLPSFSDRESPPGEPEAEFTFPPVPLQDVAPWSPGR
jgi:hypothetical protein